MNVKMKEKQTQIISCIRKSIAILAVLLLVMATFPVTSAADWSYRKPITIYGSQVQGTVTNFPVLINLSSDSDLAASAQPDGGDIVFTNAANTVRYDHEIEKFVKSTGELVAWVKIDSLSSGTDKGIHMWYGNSDCANQWNIEETWNSNYKLVQHLNESCASSGCIKDSTANNNDGTPYSGGTITNLYTSSGKMNGADSFDGSNDYVDLPASSSILTDSPFTISAWIITTVQQGAYGTEGRIVNLHRTPSYSTGAAIYAGGPAGGAPGNRDAICFLYCSIDGGGHKWLCYQTSSPVYHDGNGHLITATHDGTTAKLYYDGVEVAAESNTYGTFGTAKVKIGSFDGTSRFFEGTIDEVRVSAAARNGDWIKTSYNNQNSPSTFYTVEAQQNAGPTPPVPDLPAIILFGAGLLVIVVYAVLRRRSRR